MEWLPSEPMTPRLRYQQDLRREGFSADPVQREVVERLQDLHDRLLAVDRGGRFWSRLLARRSPVIPGLYLWGGPGRGKTYLMDCFHECLPLAAKRRVHFHRFMLEIHQALGALPRTPDPLPIVADRLAASCRVICLDEFHVTDIADAMLLGGLLRALFARRVVLVATSNLAPGDLYKDGLQRERFLPAIELLLSNMGVHHLGGGRDFRLELLRQGGTYRVAEARAGQRWLQQQMRELAPPDLFGGCTLAFGCRSLQAKARAEDVIWFDFAELCVGPRSTADYLELAREFHTLLLEAVPRFDEETDEPARRFIHLVDTLYDHGVKLIATAAAPPHGLYSGTRLLKAFQRTASRLTEMSSDSYLSRPHRPD
jgi:cell division protein ZapE